LPGDTTKTAIMLPSREGYREGHRGGLSDLVRSVLMESPMLSLSYLESTVLRPVDHSYNGFLRISKDQKRALKVESNRSKLGV
jgi:hypothetical protein